jgi:hypothetical protein
MRYTPGALAVVGSNPTGPIESSVQILPKSKGKNKRQTDFPNKPNNKNLKAVPDLSIVTNAYEMKDLYLRQDKLTYWIKRVNKDLQDQDRVDVLKLVEHMQDRERAILLVDIMGKALKKEMTAGKDPMSLASTVLYVSG